MLSSRITGWGRIAAIREMVSILSVPSGVNLAFFVPMAGAWGVSLEAKPSPRPVHSRRKHSRRVYFGLHQITQRKHRDFTPKILWLSAAILDCGR